MGLPLPVHIDPTGCTVFTEILGEFVTSHWADRVVGPYVKALLSPYLRSGGRLCPPAGYIGFTDIFGETAASQRADVGIGPYRTPANPYFPASFERKAFLQQILNRSYSQIWCTITGGAYQIARRVSTCVRNICKSDSCLNRTAGCTPRPQAPLFSPFFSGKAEKKGAPEARRKRPRRNGSQLCAERKPENVNRNFRIPEPVPVGNAVAKSGRFMYNTDTK